MSLKRKSILLFSSKLVNALITIVLLAILSRYLSKSHYGQYRQFTLITLLLTNIFSLGLPGAVLYFVSAKNKREFGATIFFIAFAIGCLLLLNGRLVAYLFDTLYKTDFFSQYWLLLSLSLALSILSMPVLNMLIATDRIKYIPLYTVLPNLMMIALLGGVVLFKISLTGVLLIFVGRQLLMFLIALFILGPDFDLRTISLKRWKEIMSFSIPLGLSGLIGIINTNVDKLLIRYFYSEETFAVFANGAYELPFLGLIAGSLYSVMVPRLKEHYRDGDLAGLTALWQRSGKILTTIMVPVGISSILFARPFINFVFSADYLDAVPIFMIYQIRLIFRIYIYGSLYTACGKNITYSLNVLVNFLLNFILDLIFIKLMGPAGAALATVLALLILIILQNWQLTRILKCSLSTIYPFKSWLLSILICLATTFILWLPYNYFKNEILGLFLLAISCTINFALLSLVVADDILRYVKRILLGLKSRHFDW